MKRINPFCEDFERIKKARKEKLLKRVYKHKFNPRKEMAIYDFQQCWWGDTGYTVDYVECFLSEDLIWGRHNNIWALQYNDIDADLAYLEARPEDWEVQNCIIEEYNNFIDYTHYHKQNYWHFHLCEFNIC